MRNTVLLMSEVDKISFTLKNGKTVEISIFFAQARRDPDYGSRFV